MLSKKLLIATSNQGKFREIGEIFNESPFQLLSLTDVGLKADFEEIGETFAENALGKARYYSSKSGLLTLSEDTGILVDALQGQLGVKTRRWGAGENASDLEWVQYFLKTMKDVPYEKRTAQFVCVAAVVGEKDEENIFHGVTEGFITQTLEAPLYIGLPLSSCFLPNGFDRVYSALEVTEKNRISHRGKAIRQAHEWLVSGRSGGT